VQSSARVSRDRRTSERSIWWTILRSGYTLLHEDAGAEGGWDGKLWRAHRHIEESLKDRVVAYDAHICVLLYVASQGAESYLRDCMTNAGLRWDLEIVQRIDSTLRILDPDIEALCAKYFDDVILDEHLRRGGAQAHMGFAGCALPVVLHHNTPNNSISLLWADTTELPESANRRALFPRRQRHTPGRT
jgi:hypothetical protein